MYLGRRIKTLLYTGIFVGLNFNHNLKIMFQEEFKNHISIFNTSPFLFIGSGFSRRYLDLPTWEDLLIKVCDDLHFKKPYDYYRSNGNQDLPRIASLMGADFNEIWWNDSHFEESRGNFQKLAVTKFSPLKYEISKLITSKLDMVNDELIEKEIRLLKKINIDGLITTNWDRLLEKIYPDYNAFVGQEELIFSELFSVGEIYKIHGCSSKPNSLVLTSEDYNIYHERNPYLAAKLLTIFMENPIIFLGYSLDDTNIQEILKSIIKCLTKEKIDKLKDRLIFCQWSSKPITPIMTDSSMLISDTVIPIKLIQLHDFVGLFTVLANNKKKLPIKVLRQMKGMVYDFVKSNNSKQKIYVTDNLDNLEDVHKAEFVYGFGLKDKFSEVGIKGVEVKDILKDCLIDNGWDANKIARLALPRLSGKYITFFKYLRKAGLLNGDSKIDEDIDINDLSPAFIAKINSITIQSFFPTANYQKKTTEINKKYNSFKQLREDNEDYHILIYTPLLEVNKIDLDDLKDYLIDRIELLNNSKLGTHFRKLVCLYDYLKYKIEKL